MASGSGREYSDTTTLKILLLRDTDSVLDAPVKDVIVPVKDEVNAGEHAELLFGTADGALYGHWRKSSVLVPSCWKPGL